MKNNETCHCEVPKSYRTINKCYICDCKIESTIPIEHNKQYNWSVVLAGANKVKAFYEIRLKKVKNEYRFR